MCELKLRNAKENTKKYIKFEQVVLQESANKDTHTKKKKGKQFNTYSKKEEQKRIIFFFSPSLP